MHGNSLGHGQSRDLVFFSYCHEDQAWLEQVQKMLIPAIDTENLKAWSDLQIDTGAKWRTEIANALDRARVAVLLVSTGFLASRFIAAHELPPILDAAARGGVRIVWIYVSACMYSYTEIGDYQAAHDVSRPLDTLSKPRRQLELLRICEKIVAAYQGSSQPGSTLMQHGALGAPRRTFQL